jgi:signal transduction histidine kinase
LEKIGLESMPTVRIRGALTVLLLIVIIPMLLLQGIIYDRWFETRWADQMRANEELARAARAVITEFIADVRNQELSLGRALIPLTGSSPNEANRLLLRTEREDPAIQCLAWLDPRGVVVAAGEPRMIGSNLCNTPYVRAILSGKEWSVSDLVPTYRNDATTLLVAQGIREAAGSLQGILVAEIEMDRLTHLIGSAERPTQETLTLFDGKGTLVYSQPPEHLSPEARKALAQSRLLRKASAGKETHGTFRFPGNQTKWVIAWAPIPGTGWVIGASQPLVRAMGPVLWNLLQVVGLTLVVVVLSVQAARRISHRITVPMNHLRRYAMSLGQDEAAPWTYPTPWIFELRELVTAFHRMAKQLRERKDALQRVNEDLELRVRERTAELQRSNEDLQQFANVASHDLQEPLRMVASYVGLLAQKYQNKLDDNAREYIHFAIDGSVRMQKLIRGLLEYSRVGRMEKPFDRVDCESVFRQVLDNLTVNRTETRAVITHDPLPEVLGDEMQLMQVFQNLVENALKFRGTDAPRIHLEVQSHNSDWVFAVHDNGIGIDPVYFNRLFVIFQRLHTRRRYPGNGIGLAICKRIVEHHGGRMWVESIPGQGSTFFFTLPTRLGVSPIEPSPTSSVN